MSSGAFSERNSSGFQQIECVCVYTCAYVCVYMHMCICLCVWVCAPCACLYVCSCTCDDWITCDCTAQKVKIKKEKKTQRFGFSHRTNAVTVNSLIEMCKAHWLKKAPESAFGHNAFKMPRKTSRYFFQIHLFSWIFYNLIFLHCSIKFHCVYVPYFQYPFLCWWTSRPISCSCYKQSSTMHLQKADSFDTYSGFSSDYRNLLPFANAYWI